MKELDLSVDMEREAKYKEIVRSIVLQILKPYSCKVYLFGSRVEGKIRRSSDFDIAIDGVPKEDFWKVKQAIREAVEESIVPHEIDVVDLQEVDARFREVFEAKKEVWKDD